MAFASMHEGIWQCNNVDCGRLYPEYVNGCVEDHAPPRKVVLIIEDGDHRIDGTNPNDSDASDRAGRTAT